MAGVLRDGVAAALGSADFPSGGGRRAPARHLTEAGLLTRKELEVAAREEPASGPEPVGVHSPYEGPMWDLYCS